MRKIVIFGNSGSVKPAFAKTLCRADGLSYLDLDTLAWMPTVPPERRPWQKLSLKYLILSVLTLAGLLKAVIQIYCK